MTSEWLDEAECSCACHSRAGITHSVACCNGLPIDFWEENYDPYFVGNESTGRPKKRSAWYEPAEDWMSFIHDKTTGRPLRGPGSDCAV